jgi:hypothetical protein
MTSPTTTQTPLPSSTSIATNTASPTSPPAQTPTVTPTPIATATALPYPTYACPALDLTRRLGDINGDDQVNLTDFSIFASDYGKDTSHGDVLNSPYSDMNCDGNVDLTDFSIFAGQYRQ